MGAGSALPQPCQSAKSPACLGLSRSTFTDKHFENNIEIGGVGSSEKSPFLLKNTQLDVFTKFILSGIVEWIKLKNGTKGDKKIEKSAIEWTESSKNGT